MNRDFAIVDAEARRRFDLLYLALLYSDEHSLVPDLYEVFGPEALIKFLDLFAGMTVKVPSRAKVIQAAREVELYSAMKTATTRSARDTIATDLSDQYSGDLSPTDVRRIWEEVRPRIDALTDFHKMVNGEVGTDRRGERR